MGYHVKDGLTFNRNEDGSINVDIPDSDHKVINIPADAWVSLVTEMSRNQSSVTHLIIEKVHMNMK